jgi:hypothetical protein
VFRGAAIEGWIWKRWTATKEGRRSSAEKDGRAPTEEDRRRSSAEEDRRRSSTKEDRRATAKEERWATAEEDRWATADDEEVRKWSQMETNVLCFSTRNAKFTRLLLFAPLAPTGPLHLACVCHSLSERQHGPGCSGASACGYVGVSVVTELLRHQREETFFIVTIDANSRTRPSTPMTA